MKKKLTALLAALAMTFMLSLSAFAEYVPVFDETAERSGQDILFEELEEEAAITLICESYAVQRTLLYDPEEFAAEHGFEPLKPSFRVNYSTDDLLGIFSGYYERLMKIDREALADRNKFEYDFMKDYFESYELLRGVDEQIFSVFALESGLAEYAKIPFVGMKKSERDILDVLEVMPEYGDFVDEMCEKELARLENGYAATPSALANEYAFCTELIETDAALLMEYFEGNLEEAGIPEESRESYRAQMREIISSVLVPAFQRIINVVEEIMAADIAPVGYSFYEGGDRYFEFILRTMVGINKSPEEMFAEAQEYLGELRAEFAGIYSDPENAALLAEPNGELFDEMTPEEMFGYIVDEMAEYFEPPVTTDYTLSGLPENVANLQGRLSFRNIGPGIRDYAYTLMLGNYDPEDRMGYLATMCHEGIPGHLYNFSRIYKYSSVFRLAAMDSLSMGKGFTEGWATYIEDYAYIIAGANDVQRRAYVINTIGGHCNGEIMALFVNGLGGTFEDFYEMSGYADMPDVPVEAAMANYSLVLEYPWDFIGYYEGWREMCRVRERAETALGEYFDEKDFHSFIMDIGFSNFDMLEKWEEVWIEKTLAAQANVPDESAPTAPEAPENPPTGSEGSGMLAVLTIAAAAALCASRRPRRN